MTIICTSILALVCFKLGQLHTIKRVRKAVRNRVIPYELWEIIG